MAFGSRVFKHIMHMMKIDNNWCKNVLCSFFYSFLYIFLSLRKAKVLDGYEPSATFFLSLPLSCVISLLDSSFSELTIITYINFLLGCIAQQILIPFKLPLRLDCRRGSGRPTCGNKWHEGKLFNEKGKK